ncbi:hypothetical protein ACLOJK_019760 [Asimina triloba]
MYGTVFSQNPKPCSTLLCYVRKKPAVMQSKVSRISLPSLLKFLSHSPPSSNLLPSSTSTPPPHRFLPFSSATHFSIIPNRPLRGEKPDHRSSSDDLFTKRLDLDDDDDNDMGRTHQNPTTQFSNRPMRGERRENRSGDLFSRKFDPGSGGIHDSGMGKKTYQDFPTQLPRRPLRGERRGGQSDDPFSQNSKFDDRVGDGIAETTLENPPTQRRERRGDLYDSLFSSEFEHDGNAEGGGPMKNTQHSSSTRAPETEATALDSSPEDADEIFKKMKETGLIPNAVAMLDGLCKDGLIQEAMKLFGLMREKGRIPEVVIYTAVVEGFCKAYKFDDAKRIFRKMQNNGISPNAFSYRILIQGLCSGTKVEDALDFFVEMLEAGHSPNVATFVGLIDGLCRTKGVEEAQGVIGRLKEKGFVIDEKAVREHMDKKGPFSPPVWENYNAKMKMMEILPTRVPAMVDTSRSVAKKAVEEQVITQNAAIDSLTLALTTLLLVSEEEEPEAGYRTNLKLLESFLKIAKEKFSEVKGITRLFKLPFWRNIKFQTRRRGL